MAGSWFSRITLAGSLSLIGGVASIGIAFYALHQTDQSNEINKNIEELTEQTKNLAEEANKIAIEANKITKNQQEFTENVYSDSLNVVWKGLYDSNKKELLLVNSNKNVELQNVQVFIPSAINKSPIKIDLSSTKINKENIENIESFIKTRLEDTFSNYKLKNEIIELQGQLPLVIQSKYIVNGGTYKEQSSLYKFKYSANAVFNDAGQRTILISPIEEFTPIKIIKEKEINQYLNFDETWSIVNHTTLNGEILE